ncbi:hypothetical protein HMPREF0497_0477 [Lentilactobacillus buchneri ATCC 11577]|nr:hypothetical protein HMPREF0497_0477 [Lentilactobacillus buchneri ATCC 11577]
MAFFYSILNFILKNRMTDDHPITTTYLKNISKNSHDHYYQYQEVSKCGS